MTSALAKPCRIGVFNDAMRQAGPQAGRWMLTAGVRDLGPEFTLLAMRAVQAFDGFTPDNDPYGEHDFGSIHLAGERLFWKLDYYDRNLEYGSDDPTDSSVTSRVITIMLASEY